MVSLFQIFDPQTDIALFVLRVVIGSLMFLHGIPKLRGHKGTANFFREMGIPFPRFNAWFVFFSETVGSIFIVLGLFTQLWALVLLGDMMVAIYVQAAKEKITLIIDNGKAGWEMPLKFATAFFVLFLLGAGDISLDAVLG